MHAYVQARLLGKLLPCAADSGSRATEWRAQALRAMRFAFLMAFFLPFFPPPTAAFACFFSDFFSAFLPEALEAAVADGLLLPALPAFAGQKVHALHLQTANTYDARHHKQRERARRAGNERAGHVFCQHSHLQ